MSGIKKLTPSMEALLAAMKAGAIVTYMPYAGRFNPNAYYYVMSGYGWKGPSKVTKAAQGLIDRGLVDKFSNNWRGYMLRAKA